MGSWIRTGRLAVLVVFLAAAVSRANAQEPAPKGKIAGQLLDKYLSNEELAGWVDEFVAKCPSIAKKFSLGKSVRGVELVGVEISDKPGEEEAEPAYKYLANMHGDEPSGRMLLPMLAEWLCANNGKHARATRMVRDMHLFLIPTVNPDGYAQHTRGNSDKVDLNRNFPDPIIDKGSDMRTPKPDAALETAAIMAFTLGHNFAASANLHEGAVVANYPWDGYTDQSMNERGTIHATPDDATFVFMAKAYASHHAFMSKSKEFPDGITNGAKWYPVYGGMQDWNYVAGGTMAITLEVSETKSRPESDLRALWGENRDALLALATAAALGGVRGNVTDASSGAPLAATLSVKTTNGAGDPVPFYASKAHGFYARPLAPGATYTLVAAMPGYETAEAQVRVPSDGSGVVQDFKLKPSK